MPMKKVKRHITLIELLVSMVLTALILSSLMFFYREITLLNARFDQEQGESFQLRFLENRLSDVLPKAVPEKTAKKDFYFFTDSDHHGIFKNHSTSLVFTFDNGVDHDKEFSNHILGRLYLDPDGNFILGMWPSPARWEEGEIPPMKKEILMEGVNSLSFQFFIPQEKAEELIPNNQKNDKVEPAPRLGWVNRWQQNYKQLPAIVRVEIVRRVNKKDKKITFAYPLPNVAIPITYKD
jgi:hypothetical protein